MSGILENPILTPRQKEFLDAFRKSPLRDAFYLTGGTALAAFYLQHRRSEDLDFFTEQETDLDEILKFLNTIGTKETRFEKKFDRRIFLLEYSGSEYLKVEFTRYPFSPAEPRRHIEDLVVDSLKDIVVNKLAAMTDRTDSKDYLDVYAAFSGSPGLSLEGMVRLAEAKFGIQGIGYILQGRFLDQIPSIGTLRLVRPVSPEDLTRFYRDQAAALIQSSTRSG